MEIYLQKPGLGEGPYLLFQVREMLSDGRLTAEDHAWHEGQAEWLAIGEMESLRALLPTPEAPESSPEPPTPPELPPTRARAAVERGGFQEVYATSRTRQGWAWRRFWARTMDLAGFYTLLWLGGYKLGVLYYSDILIPAELPRIASVACWILVEALFLNMWGTTPGKWLMGLRVVGWDGGKLPMPRALKRSASVWLNGTGLGVQVAQQLFQAFSLFRYVQLGTTTWDDWAGSTVQVKRASIFPIIGTLLAAVAIMALKGSITLQTPVGQFRPEHQEGIRASREMMRSWGLPLPEENPTPAQ
jgi:hypothetical protein